jgi:hypothetical protein
LADLLVFATGSASIPTLGFDPNPVITFGHKEFLDTSDPTVNFPVANTCCNSLRLPILTSYDEFRDNMYSAVVMATTFSIE